MSNCIKSIHNWLSNNSLSLNPNKTETIFLDHPSPKRPLTVPPFIIVNNHNYDINILYSDNVKYIGVYFDSSLSFHRHISNLLRSINFHLHSFRLIRNSIPLSVSRNLATSFILPLFDHCNILLFSLPGYQIKKLQIPQNALARSIFKIGRFSQIHISPYLKRLHWLPIQFRIIYKVLLLTHNSLHHNIPAYLSSLISIPTHTISLRSTTSYLLHINISYSSYHNIHHGTYLPLIYGINYHINYAPLNPPTYLNFY